MLLSLDLRNAEWNALLDGCGIELAAGIGETNSSLCRLLWQGLINDLDCFSVNTFIRKLTLRYAYRPISVFIGPVTWVVIWFVETFYLPQ